jgi:Peptidase family S41
MRTTGLLLLVPLAMVMAASAAQARPSAPTTAAQDVRELGGSLEELHPDPFRSVSRQRFRSEVNTLAQRAPTLSRSELLAGMLRIIALLGPMNGHTGLFPADSSHTSQLHLYPLRLYRFTDGVYVVDAQNKALIRDRVVAIGGVPIDRVFELVEPLVPRDNDSNLRGLSPHFALTAEVLDGLGIVEGIESAEFTLERPDEQVVTVTLSPITGPRYASAFADPMFGHYPSVLPAAPHPLYLSGAARPLWARTLAGGKAVYVGFNSVRLPADPLLRKIERLVRGKSVRRVIVDVRLNGGGDNTTYGSLTSLFRSPAVNRRGRLYLLTGRATFSAAANFAAEIDRDTRAIVVGEPTGGGVETYGDTFPLHLPTVGWYVHIAGRYHERKKGRNDRRLAVAPNIRVDLTSAQHFAGRDPVLDRALKGL